MEKTQTVLGINCENYDIKITLSRKTSNIMQKETFEACLVEKLKNNLIGSSSYFEMELYIMSIIWNPASLKVLCQKPFTTHITIWVMWWCEFR